MIGVLQVLKVSENVFLLFPNVTVILYRYQLITTRLITIKLSHSILFFLISNTNNFAKNSNDNQHLLLRGQLHKSKILHISKGFFGHQRSLQLRPISGLIDSVFAAEMVDAGYQFRSGQTKN